MTVPRTLVVGLGNPDRGDDAVGWHVAVAVTSQHLTGVRTRCLAEPIDLLEELDEVDMLVVVDAEVSGAAPGTVGVHELGARPLHESRSAGMTHSIGVGDALELARALARLPHRVVVVGVEAGSFDAGAALTPAVSAAVASATDVVTALVRGDAVPPLTAPMPAEPGSAPPRAAD